LTSTRLHGVISPKIELFITTAVRTSISSYQMYDRKIGETYKPLAEDSSDIRKKMEGTVLIVVLDGSY
jgi:hypothetical protein